MYFSAKNFIAKEVSKFETFVQFFSSSRLLTCGGKLFYLRKALWYFENVISSPQDLKAHFSVPLFTSLRCRRQTGVCIFNNRLSTRLGSIEHAWHRGYKRLLSLIYHLILRQLGPFTHRYRFQSHLTLVQGADRMYQRLSVKKSGSLFSSIDLIEKERVDFF